MCAMTGGFTVSIHEMKTLRNSNRKNKYANFATRLAPSKDKFRISHSREHVHAWNKIGGSGGRCRYVASFTKKCNC